MQNRTLKLNVDKTPDFYVVDDDEFVVNLIASTLSSAGFHNIHRCSSAENLPNDVFSYDQNIKFVISDVVLPGMSGFELCKKIKNQNQDILVILISGYDIEDIYTKVLDCGADDFLAKPFNPIELITRIKLQLAHIERKSETSKSNETVNDVEREKNFPYLGDKIGNYIITDTIGWGRSSLILKVNRIDTKEIFSLKILAAHALNMKDVYTRFMNEISLMERLNHPNIVKFIDKGFYNTVPYLVMEYVNGLDLEEFIITKGRIQFSDLISISHGIASAIAEIHRNNIVHRDIKLKNIIFDVRTYQPKLIDFGIAQTSDNVKLTREGFIVGTPLYMPPEIFEGENATFKSDIYSFGATIYQLTTGSPPFVGESSKELYQKHMYEDPQPISNFRNDIPASFEKLIRYCLAKKPEHRPESMDIIEHWLNEMLHSSISI